MVDTRVSRLSHVSSNLAIPSDAHRLFFISFSILLSLVVGCGLVNTLGQRCCLVVQRQCKHKENDSMVATERKLLIGLGLVIVRLVVFTLCICRTRARVLPAQVLT